MVNIIKQEIDMEDSLKRRLDIICDFCNTIPTIINGSIRKVNKTNLIYIEPHRIIINNNLFFAFNYSSEIYINNLSKKIKLLTESNEALTLRVETLTKNVKTKDKEIDELKEENHSLKSSLEHWINKFTNLIKLIKNKIFSKKETRENYMEFSRDLYTHGIINDKEIIVLKKITIIVNIVIMVRIKMILR